MSEYRRIYVTSDTHGLRHMDGVWQWAATPGLSRQDLLLVAGDTEILNQDQGDAVVKAFAVFPCDCAVIDGNHDDYRAMCEKPAVRWCGGPAHQLAPGVVALRRGEVYTPGGISLWAFGGAMMKGYEPVPGEPLPGELPTKQEFARARESLSQLGFRVDLIVTHDGPEPVVGARQYDPLRPFLAWVYESASFGLWLYGHHHRKGQGMGNVRCVYEEIVCVEC